MLRRAHGAGTACSPANGQPCRWGAPRGSRARARRTPGGTCRGLPSARRPIPCERSRLVRGAAAGPVDVSRGPPPPGRSARRRPPTAGGRRACPCASWCKRGTQPTSRSMSTSQPATRATSLAEPEPSTASASSPDRSAGDNPATISSQRNCRVAPGRRRQDQPHQRRPPGQPVARGLILAERPGERLDLGVGERERLAADLDDLARRRAAEPEESAAAHGWRARGARGAAAASSAHGRVARRPTSPGARADRR